jgi:hypothetical protein
MAKINTPLPVKLFVGMLTSVPEIQPQAEERLLEQFGAVDSRSDSFLFDQTDYYDKTMGTPIYRCFLSFANLIQPSEIANIKIITNEMESVFTGEHSTLQRPVNLDPGYLEQSKIVLASTKNFFHRILVSGGIYAEVTLHFQDNAWQSFPWTFPDYRNGLYHPYFSFLRDLYRDQLSAAGYKIRIPKRPHRKADQSGF